MSNPNITKERKKIDLIKIMLYKGVIGDRLTFCDILLKSQKEYIAINRVYFGKQKIIDWDKIFDFPKENLKEIMIFDFYPGMLINVDLVIFFCNFKKYLNNKLNKNLFVLTCPYKSRNKKIILDTFKDNMANQDQDNKALKLFIAL